jgi:hypothetical protein
MLDAVGIHFAVWRFAFGDATKDAGSLFWFETFDGRIQKLAVSEMVLIMVCKRVAVLSHDVSLWINLHHDTAAVFLPQRE